MPPKMSPAQRELVRSHVEAFAKLKWSYNKISQEVLKVTGLLVGKSTVQMMVKRIREFGNLSRRPGSGRKRKFTAQYVMAILCNHNTLASSS